MEKDRGQGGRAGVCVGMGEVGQEVGECVEGEEGHVVGKGRVGQQEVEMMEKRVEGPGWEGGKRSLGGGFYEGCERMRRGYWAAARTWDGLIAQGPASVKGGGIRLRGQLSSNYPCVCGPRELCIYSDVCIHILIYLYRNL